jgi:acyl dehydratase
MERGVDKMEEQPVHGLWWEDFKVGEKRYSAGRTVTEGDMMAFAGLTGDYSQVHTDEEFCEKTEFGTRIVHGLLGLTIAQGLCWRSNYKQGTGVASLGWDNWKFRKPLFPGDTVRVRWWATETRESKSNPNVGIIIEHVELMNQRGEVIQDGDHTQMVRRQPK